MDQPKFLDIRRVKIGGDEPVHTFRQKISDRLKVHKRVLKLRWEFLDLSLSGVIVYGAVIILAFGAAILTTRIISASVNKKPALEIAPTYSGFKVEKEAAEPATATNQTEPQTTTDPFSLPEISPAEKTPTATAPDKASFSIRVLNGNGRTGEAANTKSTLQAAGFKVGVIGNAKNTYSTTQIYYSAKHESAAKLVSENLKKPAELHEAEQTLVGDGYDILVVLGIK